MGGVFLDVFKVDSDKDPTCSSLSRPGSRARACFRDCWTGLCEALCRAKKMEFLFSS